MYVLSNCKVDGEIWALVQQAFPLHRKCARGPRTLGQLCFLNSLSIEWYLGDMRPYLGAIYQRAGTITRSHQQKLKAWQESTGREVTKVIKTHDKTSVIFVCICLFEFELQIKNSKNVVFKQFELNFWGVEVKIFATQRPIQETLEIISVAYTWVIWFPGSTSYKLTRLYIYI